MKPITIHTRHKSTTIRVSEKTKRMLELLAKRKETHEQIIQRLIRVANTLESTGGTAIVTKGNAIGTKYVRIHSSFIIEIEDKIYEVVCTYNDLSIFVLTQSNIIKEQILHDRNSASHANLGWELDLEIVNVKVEDRWVSPSYLSLGEQNLLHLTCVKKILEDTFDIQLYELEQKRDYFDELRWKDAYDRNNLSRDSLRSDVLRKIR